MWIFGGLGGWGNIFLLLQSVSSCDIMFLVKIDGIKRVSDILCGGVVAEESQL